MLFCNYFVFHLLYTLSGKPQMRKNYNNHKLMMKPNYGCIY